MQKATNTHISMEIMLPTEGIGKAAARRIGSYYKGLEQYLSRLAAKHSTDHVTVQSSVTQIGGYLSVVTDFRYADAERHGEVRTADVWQLSNGRQIPLKQLFKTSKGMKRAIIRAITAQMNIGDKQREAAIRQRLRQAINVKRYYLTETAIHLFTSDRQDFAVPYNMVTKLQPLCAESPNPA